MEDDRPKGKQGIKKINHCVFSPSTGTKRRLEVVERFNRTFREKYVKYVGEQRAMNAPPENLYFKKAIPEILEDYNFRDDHKTIKEFITRQIGKGKHYFTEKYPNRLTSSKAPKHMLKPGREEEFMKWKAKQTKKVDSIQKDRIDELKKVKKVEYFKGLFHTTKRGKKKGDEVLTLKHQFI